MNNYNDKKIDSLFLSIRFSISPTRVYLYFRYLKKFWHVTFIKIVHGKLSNTFVSIHVIELLETIHGQWRCERIWSLANEFINGKQRRKKKVDKK